MGGTMDARRAAVRAMFADLLHAYGEKDFDRFARHVAADAVFEWPYLPLKSFPSRMEGRDAFIAMSKAGMEDCDGYHHRIDALHDQHDPDMLIAEYHSDTLLRTSGVRYSNRYLGILRFAGDRLVYWKEYLNPLTVAEAFGLDFSNEALA